MKELLTRIAVSLERIALAQEQLVRLAALDTEQIINDEVKNRLDDEVTTTLRRRSFIGKRSNNKVE